MTIKAPKIIETSRLLLEEPSILFRSAYLEAVIESFEELNRWVTWATHLPTGEDANKFIKSSQKKWEEGSEYHYFLLQQDTKKFLGVASLRKSDSMECGFEIGYWMRRSESSKGYMTEAVWVLTRMALDSLNAQYIEIRCDPNNIGSRKIPEKLGFELAAKLKKTVYFPQHKKWFDSLLYRYNKKISL